VRGRCYIEGLVVIGRKSMRRFRRKNSAMHAAPALGVSIVALFHRWFL
jgi:hypothetical protein